MRSNTDTTETDGLCATAVRDCYQCGKCSAGCPMADQMDLLPNQLVRLVQLERIDRAVRSEAIWLCVSCMTCSTRCPKSVDCAGVIDALRQRAVAENAISPERRRVVVFQRAFLDNVRRNGRLCEFSLVGAFKTKALLGDGNIPLLFQDGLLAPQLMRRRKFHFRGQRVRDRAVVRRIFEKCETGDLEI